MITQEDLFELGYTIKTKPLIHNGSTDFIHTDSISRPYLVNVSEDQIQIIFDSRVNKPIITFQRFSDFKNFHDKY